MTLKMLYVHNIREKSSGRTVTLTGRNTSQHLNTNILQIEYKTSFTKLKHYSQVLNKNIYIHIFLCLPSLALKKSREFSYEF